MINHNKLQSKLQDYLEQVLPDTERQDLESHLADCHECQQELTALNELVRCLEALPEQIPPSELTASIMARVQDESIKISYWDMVKSWLPKLGYAYAIGLGLVYILGYITYRYISQTDLSLLKMFNQMVIFISNGIAKLCELGLGIWIASSSLIRYGFPTISTCLLIETILIIAGLYYWYFRKHKAIQLMVLN
jgi:hypothetical protein